MDEAARKLLRAWRADPADPAAADACAAALHRARVELPWELIATLPRWRRTIELLGRFGVAPPTASDGWHEAALLEAEGRLGRRLPVALREWYRLLGRYRGAPALLDRTIPPARLAWTDDLLVVQARDSARLCVQLSDLDAADPPLLVHDDVQLQRPRVGQRLARTFAGNALHELAESGPWAAGVQSARLDGLVGWLNHGAWSADYEPLGFRGVPLGELIPPRRARGNPLHVDLAAGVLVMVLNPGAVQLRAVSRDALASAEARLAGLRRLAGPG